MDELIQVTYVPLVQGIDDFDVFYRLEYRAVLGLCIVLTGTRSTAEEIAQEAFTAAYRSWSKVSALDRPGAWVRRVASNKSVSVFRKLRSEASAMIRVGTDHRLPDPTTSIDTDLWAEVRRLPRRQAQVVALTYINDLSRRSVAEILGLSEETVKTHLDRARRTLATKLADPGGTR